MQRPLDGLLRAGLAAADCGPPKFLDELEELRALLLDDHLAEERAEQLDLASQWVSRCRAADAARLRTARRFARVPGRPGHGWRGRWISRGRRSLRARNAGARRNPRCSLAHPDFLVR